jgi:hypothetical protein
MNSLPSSFWEWMGSLSSDDRAGLSFAVIAAVVGVIAIVATTIHHMHRNRLEDSLKREMLDRGMSAEEISTVLARSKRGMMCGPRRDKA